MATLVIGELEEKPIHVNYFLMISCALISYINANLFTNSILNTMILANIPIVALSFALLAGFYWHVATRQSVYYSVTIGIAWG